MAQEAADDFKSSLSDLTFNSKPLINMLTMLAEENVQYAEQIVNVIEEHLKEVAPSYKLPALYLIDSIIKNISDTSYVQLFTKNIVNTFVTVFERVDEKTRQAMFKLRQTWNDLFPNKKLYTLDVRVNHIDPAWPVTAQPPQGTANIHVNPKFLMKHSLVSTPVVESSISRVVDHGLQQKKDDERQHVKDEEEAKLIQQQIALESLKEEQQRLEKQLAEARSRLEQQARMLREGPPSSVTQLPGSLVPSSKLPATSCSLAVPSSAQMTLSHLAVTKASVLVAPYTRDPRMKLDTAADSRETQQTAVVLPTQAKPLTCVDTSDQLRPTSGNIFDRLQNLAVAGKTFHTSDVPISDPSVSASVIPVPVTSTVSPARTEVQGLDASCLSSSLQRDCACNEVSEDTTCTSTSTVMDTEESGQYSSSSKSSEQTMLTAGCGKTSPVSVRRASKSSSGSKSSRASKLKVALRDSNKEANHSVKNKRDGLKGGRRRTSGCEYNKTAAEKPSSSASEKDAAPAAKKMRSSKNDELSKDTDSAAGLPSDLAELFGKEDVDYRIPKLQPPPMPPLSPNRNRPSLLGVAPSVLHTAGWANFKAKHPDDFSQEVKDTELCRNASDLDFRKKLPLLPTPDVVEDRMRLIRDQDQKERHLGDDITDSLDASSMHSSGFCPRGEESRPFLSKKPLESHGRNRSPMHISERSHCYDEPNRKAFYEHDEQKVLLPTPSHPTSLGPRDSSISQEYWDAPVKSLSYNEKQFYVPEYDVRWWMRSKMSDKVSNTYSVVIDGRQFSMTLNRPRWINCAGRQIEVRLDSLKRHLLMDGVECYRFGCAPNDVSIRGNKHRVFVHGPEKKLWIDDHLFEINVDGPPEKINIGGKVHEIRIDTSINYVIVDDYNICQCDVDEKQTVTLAFVLHTISFKAPKKEILIDGNLCTLDLGGKYPVVFIGGKPCGIRFDGEPRYIFIDDKPYLVPMDWARKCRIDGPKPRLLAFGGPGHEVIIDDQWFEVKFNGAEKFIKFGGSTHKVYLKGNPPEVKILPEVVLASDLRSRLREAAVDNRSLSGPLRSNYQQHNARPDFDLNRPHAIKRVPPLMGVEKHESRPPLVDHARDPRVLAKDTARNSPVKCLPLLESNFAEHRSASAPFLGTLERVLQPPETSRAAVSLSFERPLTGSRSDALENRLSNFPSSYIGTGRPYHLPDTHPSASSYGSPADAVAGNTVASKQDTLTHLASSGGIDNFPAVSWPQTGAVPVNAPTPEPSQGATIDVNLLLQQLLAKGLIGQKNSNNTQEVQTPASTVLTTDTPTATITSDISTDDKNIAPVDEEETDDSKVEEELVENIPTISDFVIDDLRKRYIGAIQQLYVGVCCSSCGVRFKSDATDSYNEHLDWHFRQNRYEKEGMKVARHRRWYYDVVDWIQFEEVVDLEEKAQTRIFESENETSAANNLILPECLANVPDVITCPQASGDEKEDICDICQESFEQFWNEEHEAWHLKDAISVTGKVYHPVCFEDAKECFLNESMAEQTVSSESIEPMEINDDTKKIETDAAVSDAIEETVNRLPTETSADNDNEQKISTRQFTDSDKVINDVDMTTVSDDASCCLLNGNNEIKIVETPSVKHEPVDAKPLANCELQVMVHVHDLPKDVTVKSEVEENILADITTSEVLPAISETICGGVLDVEYGGGKEENGNENYELLMKSDADLKNEELNDATTISSI